MILQDRNVSVVAICNLQKIPKSATRRYNALAMSCDMKLEILCAALGLVTSGCAEGAEPTQPSPGQ